MAKSAKPDFSPLVDGKTILEVAYYAPEDHRLLKRKLGAYWFTQEIEIPFLGRYHGKFIAVIDYSAPLDYRMQGNTTKQIFGIGATPEEAAKDALASFLKAYEPMVAALNRALKAIQPTVSTVSPFPGDMGGHRGTVKQKETT